MPAREDGVCNPKGFYSITKRAAEQLLISYCETTGMKYRILRLANVVGNSDSHISNKKNALQFMLNKLKNNEEVQLYDGGDGYRDFIYIDDCVDAIHTVITKGKTNEIYNVGTGRPTRISDVVLKARQQLNSLSEVKSIPTPEFHKVVQVKSMYLNVKKLSELGFIPMYRTYEEWLPKLLGE